MLAAQREVCHTTVEHNSSLSAQKNRASASSNTRPIYHSPLFVFFGGNKVTSAFSASNEQQENLGRNRQSAVSLEQSTTFKTTNKHVLPRLAHPQLPAQRPQPGRGAAPARPLPGQPRADARHQLRLLRQQVLAHGIVVRARRHRAPRLALHGHVRAQAHRHLTLQTAGHRRRRHGKVE